MSFYSDVLIEAHDPHPEMFGTPRFRSLLVQHPAGTRRITTFFLEELKRSSGENWEQEDAITLIALNLRLRVLSAVDAGKAREEVAKTFSVSMPTIKRWLRRRFRETAEKMAAPDQSEKTDPIMHGVTQE